MTVVHIQLVSVDATLVVPPGMPGQWEEPESSIPRNLFSEVIVSPGLPPKLLNLASSEVIVGYRPPKTEDLIAADFKQRSDSEAASPTPAHKAVLQITKPVPVMAVATGAQQRHTSRSLTQKPQGRRPGFIAPASTNARPPSARDLRRYKKDALPKVARVGLAMAVAVALVLLVLITVLAALDNGWFEAAKVEWQDLDFPDFL